MPTAARIRRDWAPTRCWPYLLLFFAPRPQGRNVEVHKRIRELSGAEGPAELPVPMFNVLNGGAHASGSTDFQEFMVVPVGFETFSDALRAGSQIYQRLKTTLDEDGLSTNVGDEGGFAPPGLTNRMALEYITRAVESAGYAPGKDVFIALDPAASEFYEPRLGPDTT